MSPVPAFHPREPVILLQKPYAYQKAYPALGGSLPPSRKGLSSGFNPFKHLFITN